MRLWRLGTILVAAALLGGGIASADDVADLRAEIGEIRQQLSEMDDLKARLADLEKKLEESETARKAATPTVTTAYPGAKLRVDGRMFTGIFDTGDEGTSPNASTDIPDAKLRFLFTPSEKITAALRLNGNGASTPTFDYVYVDFAGALWPSNIIRIGQHKLDVGQETIIDNPVENILVTNSVPHISGTAMGIALLGRFTPDPKSPLYEAGFFNGPRGVLSRPTTALPFNLKLGTPLPGDMFASVSYCDSGNIGGNDNSAITVAEIASAPTGSTEWRRRLWELDVRYNYGASGVRSVVPWGELPKLMLGATYGAFGDNAVGVADRDGTFWFVEGLLRLTPRLYTAARYSTVDLDDGLLANLGRSPSPVNTYARTSIGLGYKLTDLTLLKTEYAFNHTTGGPLSPSLNQWALGVATKF